MGNIVHLFRKRLDPHHIDRIEQSIRSCNAVATDINTVIEGIGDLDIEQLEKVFYVVEEVFPKPFFEGRNFLEMFRLLYAFRTLMETLSGAIYLGTAITDRGKRKGRPTSRYVSVAVELINAWEIATSERLNNSSGFVLQRVPTPKRTEAKLEAKDDWKLFTKQPSTQFVGIVLRIIDPTVKGAEVITAIKKALAFRDKQYEFIRDNSSKSFLDQIKALQRISDA